MYPNRVWEPTRVIEVNGEELQLWTSREPTMEDHKRRREYKAQMYERVEKMKERILEEDTRKITEELRRKG